MRVLLAVAWYFPDSVGGTETYVRDLARGLRQRGVDVSIAAPLDPGDDARSYEHDGILVHRYAVPRDQSARLDPTRPEPAGWSSLLARLSPDIVHLHSITTDLELPHLRAAKRCGAAIALTVHLPGLICARGTLLKFGESPCDGDLATAPCTACRLQARGVPAALGHLAALVPPMMGVSSRWLGAPEWLTSALDAGVAHDRRREWLSAVVRHADRVVAVSRWLADVLGRNGVPREKLVVCRHGVSEAFLAMPPAGPHAGALRIGFVGRSDPLKGLHVFVEAARMVPHDANVEFHIWTSARTTEAQAYEADMRRQTAGDARLHFHGETQAADVAYRAIDVLAVPSQWMETGPLVVLEAQAAGLPVIGSNIGGIPEHVTHEVNGLLVPPGDTALWAQAFVRLARDRHLVSALAHAGPVRQMTAVATETLDLYRELAGSRSVDTRRSAVATITPHS